MSWVGAACLAAVSLSAVSCLVDASSRAGERAERVGPRILWRIDEEGRGTPAVAGRLAAFLSRRHRVVGVDVITGRVQWVSGTGGGGDATIGSRVVSTGSLFVAGDGELVAYDTAGHMRWRFAPEDGPGTGPYLGTAAGQTVFTGSARGRLFAIDAETGRARWVAEAPDADATTMFAPVVDHGLVVAGFTTFGAPPTGGVIAVDAATGITRWMLRFRAGAAGVSGYGGGPVAVGPFVAAASQDGTIVLAERATGRVVRALAPVGEALAAGLPPVDQDFRPLAAFGGLVVAGSLTGTVVAYDAASGQERWRERPVAASVALALAIGRGGDVYVPYLSGELVCLDAATGQEQWRTTAAPAFSWAPAVVGERVYAAASRAGFFALIDPVAHDVMETGAIAPRSRENEEDR